MSESTVDTASHNHSIIRAAAAAMGTAGAYVADALPMAWAEHPDPAHLDLVAARAAELAYERHLSEGGGSILPRGISAYHRGGKSPEIWYESDSHAVRIWTVEGVLHLGIRIDYDNGEWGWWSPASTAVPDDDRCQAAWDILAETPEEVTS